VSWEFKSCSAFIAGIPAAQSNHRAFRNDTGKEVEVLINILCQFNSNNRVSFLVAMFTVLMIPSFSSAQKATAPPDNQETSKHILGIIPNNRTAPSLKNYHPLTTGQKFKIAADDAFDPGAFALAALFAGDGQLTDSNPSFRQGVKGYAHYYVTSFADLAIGDFMTEAIFPAMLHQDPRFFRRGYGGGWSRLGYAMGQIFFTHDDSGKTDFNFSEIVGNSTAVAISQAYYPDNRNATNATVKLMVQIGTDMTGNVLKEFWPDITRIFSRKGHRTQETSYP
jgi:hypothetical protein